MGWLEFSANIIDNVLSWPAAVLLIVFLLRKQLRELFHTIENVVLEWGGTKVSLTRSLERAREGVAAVKPDEELEAPKPNRPKPDRADRELLAKENQYLSNQYLYTSELAQKNPSQAIEVAWHRFIAEQVRRLADDRDLPPDGDTTYLLNELNSRGVVPDAIVDSVKNLGKVRFEVGTTHREPSPNEALEYTQIASQVGRYLNYPRSDIAKSQGPL